jgi:hypothetical protein
MSLRVGPRGFDCLAAGPTSSWRPDVAEPNLGVGWGIDMDVAFPGAGKVKPRADRRIIG